MSELKALSARATYCAMTQWEQGYEPHYAVDPSWEQSGLHCHDFYELYVHFGGAEKYCVDSSVYAMEPNQLYVLPPFTMHGHVGSGGLQNYERAFLYITSSQLKKAGGSMLDVERFLSQYTAKGRYQYQMTAKDARICRELICEMAQSGAEEGALGALANFRRMLHFLQLVCETVQRSGAQAEPVPASEAIYEVLAYVNEHYNQPVKLDALARRFGVSVSYLSHSFVRYTGRSVYDYVLYRRVLQAKEMIIAGMSLSEIAWQCGFSDYSSFLRAFKKMAGTTPNVYRKMAAGR